MLFNFIINPNYSVKSMVFQQCQNLLFLIFQINSTVHNLYYHNYHSFTQAMHNFIVYINIYPIHCLIKYCQTICQLYQSDHLCHLKENLFTNQIINQQFVIQIIKQYFNTLKCLIMYLKYNLFIIFLQIRRINQCFFYFTIF